MLFKDFQRFPPLKMDGNGKMAFGLSLPRDGTFTDPYGGLKQQTKRQRSSNSRSRTPVEIKKTPPQPTREPRKAEVSLKINGVLNPDMYGHTFVSGFCDGFYGIVIINTSDLSFEDRQLESPEKWLPLFDKHCCGGRKKHVIKDFLF